jgi:hypothetical protein
MSRFYGRVRGQAKTEATRRGSANSQLVTECNGWDIGVRCIARPGKADEDLIEIWLTGGSNGYNSTKPIGTVSLDNEGNLDIALS